MAAHRGGDREGLRARLATVGNRRRPGARATVGLQGGHVPEEVLHRDLPLLRGSRLHGPARGAVSVPRTIEPLLGRVLARVTVEASGIDFSHAPPRLRLRPDDLSTEGRVYYIGPRADAAAGAGEARHLGATRRGHASAGVARHRSPVSRRAFSPATVRCYSFEEVFAEKIRAMAQRARPRDLYDIVNLFRRNDLRLYPEVIRLTLEREMRRQEHRRPDRRGLHRLAAARRRWRPTGPTCSATSCPHCRRSGVPRELPVSSAGSTARSSSRHCRQCRSRPTRTLVVTAANGRDLAGWGAAGDACASPPPTTSSSSSTTTGGRVSSSRTHFAAPVLDASSFTPSAPTEAAIAHTAWTRSTVYGSRPTPFTPRFPIEFSAHGPLHAPAQSRSSIAVRSPRSQSRRRPYGQREYIYACSVCGREFVHTRRSGALRKHKDTYGYPCRGRSGRYVGTR